MSFPGSDNVTSYKSDTLNGSTMDPLGASSDGTDVVRLENARADMVTLSPVGGENFSTYALLLHSESFCSQPLTHNDEVASSNGQESSVSN